jgi:uncharacterized protein (UPF0333 family)
MLYKLLFSKKGQVSMELGIIVFSSIVVGAIVSYYWIYDIKQTQMETGKNVNKTVHVLNNKSALAIEGISNL